MLKYIFAAVVPLFLFSFNTFAQQLIATPGKVEVVQDEKITQLTEQYRKMSLNNPESDGFRVQVFFDSGSNSKNAAANAKAEFDMAYPGVRSYLSYKEPYYRVRVGDFRTLTEAYGFQKNISGEYPNSFPVKEKIFE